ncbi:MAG: hypothetical protein HC915_21185 [Anaerolineae bacterium]|nr:hypothetical protein [Anaerolineae bacterium]
MKNLEVTELSGQIVALHLQDYGDPTLRKWARLKPRLLGSLPSDTHLRLLFDLRTAGYPEPDIMDRLLRDVYDARYALWRSTALLTVPTVLGWMERAAKRLPPGSREHVGVFLEEHRALAWLENRSSLPC